MTADGSLSGRVALVTGAAGGIGLATARRLAGDGATVGCLDRDEGRLAAAVDELEADGLRAVALLADVTDPAAVGGPRPRSRRRSAWSGSSSITPASAAKAGSSTSTTQSGPGPIRADQTDARSSSTTSARRSALNPRWSGSELR